MSCCLPAEAAAGLLRHQAQQQRVRVPARERRRPRDVARLRAGTADPIGPRVAGEAASLAADDHLPIAPERSKERMCTCATADDSVSADAMGKTWPDDAIVVVKRAAL